MYVMKSVAKKALSDAKFDLFSLDCASMVKCLNHWDQEFDREWFESLRNRLSRDEISLNALTEAFERRSRSSQPEPPPHDHNSQEHTTHFVSSDSSTFLDAAIVLVAKALAEAAEPKAQALLLSRLCEYHSFRFRRTLDPSDLHHSLGFRQKALQLADLQDFSWWPFHHRMDRVFLMKLRRYPGYHVDEPNDLLQAVHSERQGVCIARDNGDQQLLRNGLDILARLLVILHLQNNSLTDLEEAIQNHHEAMSIPNLVSSSDNWTSRCELSNALLLHYSHTNDSRSLHEALEHSEAVLLHAQVGGSGYRRIYDFSLHATLLWEHFEKENTETRFIYMDKAIQCVKDGRHEFEKMSQAVQSRHLMPATSLLHQLGKYSCAKGAATGDWDLWQSGCTYSVAALDFPQHPDRREHLNALAKSIVVAHYDQRQSGKIPLYLSDGKSVPAICLAVDCAREAVCIGGCNVSCGISASLLHFAEALRSDVEGIVEMDSVCHSVEALLGVAKDPYCDLRSRIIAAATASQTSLGRYPWPWPSTPWPKVPQLLRRCHDTIQELVSLIPRICPRPVSAADTRLVITGMAGIASIAAAAALELADLDPLTPLPEKQSFIIQALRSLEVGRCVLSGRLMISKSDTSELRKIDREVCDQYEKVREKVHAFGGGNFSSQERGKWPNPAVELAQLEGRIRQLPGMENFQRLLDANDFKSLAKYGPIVTFNIEGPRKDAIIVTVDSIRTISLPNLDLSKLTAGILKFVRNERSWMHQKVPIRSGSDMTEDVEGRDGSLKQKTRENISNFLEWLWVAAVKPILDAVEDDLTPSRRIWWVTNGVIGLAPFHAAGSRQPGSNENTMSRVVSSYISSFTALQHTLQRSSTSDMGLKMLQVTMPTSPGRHSDLSVAEEEKAIGELFDEDNLTTLKCPSPQLVLSHLSTHRFAHFACHGILVESDPTQSGLILVEDDKEAVLTISDLEKTNHEYGEVACLSACSTAALVNWKLIDESITMANAFQAVGFRHVIGTMWSVRDKVTGLVVGGLYKRLKHENESTGKLSVAQALHDSIMEYKEKYGGQDVWEWAAFIHIGG